MKQELTAATAAKIELLLAELLLEGNEEVEGTEMIDHVDTFGDAGILTTDRGIVIRTHDRREFQITIVRSK
jgi:hypothetical protein